MMCCILCLAWYSPPPPSIVCIRGGVKRENILASPLFFAYMYVWSSFLAILENNGGGRGWDGRIWETIIWGMFVEKECAMKKKVVVGGWLLEEVYCFLECLEGE